LTRSESVSHRTSLLKISNSLTFFDWDPIRAEHYGQRLHLPHQQAGRMTAPDQCCINVRKFLPWRHPHVTQLGHAAVRRTLLIFSCPDETTAHSAIRITVSECKASDAPSRLGQCYCRMQRR